jgi:hypothetical protein
VTSTGTVETVHGGSAASVEEAKAAAERWLITNADPPGGATGGVAAPGLPRL